MDDHSGPKSGWSVEFLDDGDGLPYVGDDTGPSRSRRLLADRRPSWFAVAVSAGMAAGAIVTIVSLYLTQLIARPSFLGGPELAYAVNGFGHIHPLGRDASRGYLSGSAPALGDVALIGAIALLAAALLAVVIRRGTVVSALIAGGACLAAGAIAAALGCEAILDSGFPRYSWAAGFWVSVAGASIAVVAALSNAGFGLSRRAGFADPGVPD